ncbi:hypothetical protein [Amycolatopsis sp. MtRt-6]|uniref:hypothetical protein n=1 Tax=Amycolatopsis sp. MtRt-6 TaxID=2792782 RepID=UPI001F5C9755|nr:hypothetical protein [Amycolatopsis sp. MtRt-6]
MKSPVAEGAGRGGARMSENDAFAEFPPEIRRRVASYLTVTSRAGIPEVSQYGSEGSESTESSESSERSEGKEGTESSETSERSESTETSENSETTEMTERYGGQFPGPR